MTVSKTQKTGVQLACACGCKEYFRAFPVYTANTKEVIAIKGVRGGILYVPKYKRGHHPRCRGKQFGEIPAWNKGMKRGDHPSLDNMGFQTQHGQPKIRVMESREGKAFIAFIMDRDGHKCTQCGGTDMLQTHHKETLRDAPHRAMDPENVVTLCAGCHGRIHANQKVENRNSKAAPK